MPSTVVPATARRRVTAAGLFGGVLICVGSLSTGWIGPNSNVTQLGIIEAARRSETLRTWWSVVVIVGGTVLVLAWIRLGTLLRQSDDRPSRQRTVLTAAVAWAVPLLVTVPLYSRDMFAYVAQGRLMLAGYNPYQEGVSVITDWYGIGADPQWSQTKTPYGPLFLGIEQFAAWLAGDSPSYAIVMFRLIATAGAAATAWYAYRIITDRGGDPVQALWLLAASPIVLFNSVVAGHNDALMLAFIVAGMFYAGRGRPWLAVVLVAGAIAVKPIAVIALPVVGLIWAGPGATLKVIAKYWAISAAVALGLIGALGFALGVGVGWIGALATPGSVNHWYAPVNMIGSLANGFSRLTGYPGNVPRQIVSIIFLVIMAATVVWIMTTRRPIEPLTRLALAFGAAVICSPFIHPWYAAWVIVLFTVAGIPTSLRLHLLATASVFFAWVSVQETQDVPVNIAGSHWPTTVRALFSIASIGLLTAYYCAQQGWTVASIVARFRELGHELPRDVAAWRAGG